MEENQMNVLDELHKGTCMGKDAIHYVLEKVENADLKTELERQYDRYRMLSDKICRLYPEYGEGTPHRTNAMDKMMVWSGIEMKTMRNDSPSKIAEMMVKGTNMGIIEGRRLLNHKETDAKVTDLIREYVDIQEEAVEKLKPFL